MLRLVIFIRECKKYTRTISIYWYERVICICSPGHGSHPDHSGSLSDVDDISRNPQAGQTQTSDANLQVKCSVLPQFPVAVAVRWLVIDNIGIYACNVDQSTENGPGRTKEGDGKSKDLLYGVFTVLDFRRLFVSPPVRRNRKRSCNQTTKVRVHTPKSPHWEKNNILYLSPLLQSWKNWTDGEKQPHVAPCTERSSLISLFV